MELKYLFFFSIVIGTAFAYPNSRGFVVDATTEPGADYAYFPAAYPGIQIRVNVGLHAYVSLSPEPATSLPIYEILIGCCNNTMSRIFRNNIQVVAVSTPNILREGQWNSFRLTWSNNIILVFKEGQSYPFISFTMDEIFPVNFFGLRSPRAQAIWNITPVPLEMMKTAQIEGISKIQYSENDQLCADDPVY